jgi:protein ImuA
MHSTREDIIAKLQRDILPLQGFKRSTNKRRIGLGALENAFPCSIFPLGAVHEFICMDNEAVAVSGGFISVVVGKLMQNNGATVWISSSQNFFPPALCSFGIKPEKIIFISLKNQKDILWAIEEALKCEGLSAVIAETEDLSFTVSRRFQLAVEKTGVTGFILNRVLKKTDTTACISRWQVSPLPSLLPGDMPGVGFPRWNVELSKVRNGIPGSWQIEYSRGRFQYINNVMPVVKEVERKTG